MSTLKETTMHPRCRNKGACWDLLECWFKLFSTSQIQFRTFLKKKIKFLGSHVVVLVKTFPLTHQLLNYVGLIFHFSAYGNSGYRQNTISSISNFLKKFHIFGFPWCSTREDNSIAVSITNVGLILTKLRWFQVFVKSQNSNFELFWKKKSVLLRQKYIRKKGIFLLNICFFFGV